MRRGEYNAITIGASAGGLQAVSYLFEDLPVDYPLPVVLTQHRTNDRRDLLEEVLQHKCKILIKQADEKEKIKKSCIYIAPPGYHLFVENDYTFSLSSDERAYSKPSIDILFESAAQAYRETLIGVILTGANMDGADGMATIRKYGGMTIAQDPREAQYSLMPQAAIDKGGVLNLWTLYEIRKFMLELAKVNKNETG
jgi:two-component system, chemotaxis family, protein-glutamate methylesterase/glutaminase